MTIDSEGNLLVDGTPAASYFPILQRRAPNGEPLIYLDSAATALKPQCVVDAVNKVLTEQTANIHRSVHFLGDEATEAYEGCRDITAAFINAEPNEIVFLRNTTEALNLVASSFVGSGKIVSSIAEHHSNLLPWGDNVVRLGIDEKGAIDTQQLEQALAAGGVSLVSLSQASNVTGQVNDIAAITAMAHAHGAKVLVDAAQSAPHMAIDVDALGCDFLAFSGHKLGAPTGVGVLFGKAEPLEQLRHVLHGGSTVEEVHIDSHIDKKAPWKFEAGTPAIESVVGLSAALGFLLDTGMDVIEEHFAQLSAHARQEIAARLPANSIVGSDDAQASGPFSLFYPGISPHIIARGLSDRYGICLRSGFHCAQPLHETLGVPASLRLSFWMYNNKTEISKAVDGIAQLTEIVGS